MLTGVLAQLLAPADLPPATDVAQLTARYRSELARRRLLLLADNARIALYCVSVWVPVSPAGDAMPRNIPPVGATTRVAPTVHGRTMGRCMP